MSFEAVAWVRRTGGSGEFAQKWLTVPTDDREAARAAFKALGFDVRGMSILTQTEATEAAARI